MVHSICILELEIVFLKKMQLFQILISTAILLMAIGATIALVLLPQYPHWLSSRVETAQNWVDDIWPQTLNTSNEFAR